MGVFRKLKNLQGRTREAICRLNFGFLNKKFLAGTSIGLSLLAISAVLLQPNAFGSSSPSVSSSENVTVDSTANPSANTLGDDVSANVNIAVDENNVNVSADAESGVAGSTKLNVNGQDIPVPQNGTSQQTISSGDNNVNVNVQSSSSGASDDNDNSSIDIDISSDSNTSSRSRIRVTTKGDVSVSQ